MTRARPAPTEGTQCIRARERWRRNYSEAARHFLLFQNSYFAAYDF